MVPALIPSYQAHSAVLAMFNANRPRETEHRAPLPSRAAPAVPKDNLDADDNENEDDLEHPTGFDVVENAQHYEDEGIGLPSASNLEELGVLKDNLELDGDDFEQILGFEE